MKTKPTLLELMSLERGTRASGMSLTMWGQRGGEGGNERGSCFLWCSWETNLLKTKPTTHYTWNNIHMPWAQCPKVHAPKIHVPGPSSLLSPPPPSLSHSRWGLQSFQCLLLLELPSHSLRGLHPPCPAVSIAPPQTFAPRAPSHPSDFSLNIHLGRNLVWWLHLKHPPCPITISPSSYPNLFISTTFLFYNTELEEYIYEC